MAVWGKSYKGVPIKSDYRVHDQVVRLLGAEPRIGELLDIATGKGALAARLKDECGVAQIDINDFAGEAIIDLQRKHFSQDLNEDFEGALGSYDAVVAVEILEHLENPWHFLRNLSAILKPGAIAIISTPNTDSFLDRLWVFIHGYPFYFGEAGYENSDGHITMIPDWLIRKIAGEAGLEVIDRSAVSTAPHFGRRMRLLAFLLWPIYVLLGKEKNDRSINIYKLKKRTQ